MKKLFTKVYYVAAVIILFVGASLQANAQYSINTIGSNVWCSAVTSDTHGNVYAVEAATETNDDDNGKVLKYVNGTGTPIVVYNGAGGAIPFTDCDEQQMDSPMGIAVTANGDVYVTTNWDPFANNCGSTWGNIIKIPSTGNNTWASAPVTFLAGSGTFGLFTSLAVDANNNLYCLVYDASGNGGASTNTGLNGSYEIEEFPATGGVPSTTGMARVNGSDGLHLWLTALNSGDTFLNEQGLAIDPSGNIYVNDSFDQGGTAYSGEVYKLTKGSGSSYSASPFTTGLFTCALGTDSLGNVYTVNQADFGTGFALSLIEYTGGSTTVANTHTLSASLGVGGPLGWYVNTIAPVNSSNIFVDNGSTGGNNNGDLDQLIGPAPTTQASSISFSGTTSTSTSISWTNGNGAGRAVFMAAASSGTPSPAIASFYTANTVFGSGPQAGSGWYCVYNGPGNSVNVTGLSLNTTYRVMVVDYNGASSYTNYDTNTGTGNPNNVTTATPAIIAPGGTVTVPSTPQGTAGPSTSFAISATNLTPASGNLTIAAPTNVQVSSDNATWNSSCTISYSGSNLGSTPVFVRLSGTGTVGGITGNISVSGGGATAVTQAVSGSLNAASTALSSIALVNAATNNLSSVQYTVMFAAAVGGLGTTNFTATGVSGTLTGQSVTGVGGSNPYTVTVNTGSGSGTLRLDFTSNSGLTPTVSNEPYTAGPSYTIDKTLPAATISAPSVASTGNSGSGSVTYTVTYSDANFNTSNLTGAGITLITTGTATGTIGVSGSGTSYTVTISGITGLGSIAISVAGGSASDLAGNTDAGAGPSAPFNVVSSDASLSSLALSQGTLMPAFTPGHMSYIVGVSNIVASVTVTPASNDPTATIQVNGVTVSSGTQSASIALAEGAVTTINTVVTAQDGTTTETYSISINRAPSNNNLLSTIALTPHTMLVNTGTVGTITTYTTSVGNATASVMVTPATQDPNATIKVNGIAVTSGAVSGSIALAEGAATTITTVVTAQDGTTRTYLIIVSRAPSGNARLSTIALTPHTMLVNTGTVGTTTTYTTSVGNPIASVMVTPTTQDANATIKVNGVAVTSGAVSGSIALAEGATTTITTIVTAQDGTTRTYSIIVTRAPSSNASLSTIALTPDEVLVNNGTIGHVTTYTTSVLDVVTSVTVTPTAQDANATIKVNGITVTSGTASLSIALPEGTTTTIITIVTAQDGTTTETYSIFVTRPSTTNALLSTIALTPHTILVNTGTVGTTTNYTASVSNATESVMVTPTTQDPIATVTVNGITVPSGTASGGIALAVGQTTITIVVTARDGTTNWTYSITVTRAAGPPLSLYQPVSVVKPAGTVAIENDGIVVHQGVSPNGDGINDFLTIDGIIQYPDNSLMIIDRNGELIYQAKGYDNGSKAFDGRSSINGRMQQPGTYFYSLDYIADGQSKHKTGYIELKY